MSECAFESAALHNPDRPVLMVADGGFPEDGLFGGHLRGLPNLRLVKVDFAELTEGLATEVWNNFMDSGVAIEVWKEFMDSVATEILPQKIGKCQTYHF